MEGDRVLQPQGVRGAHVVQWGDVDNDGIMDLFYGRHTNPSDADFKDDGLRSEIWLG